MVGPTIGRIRDDEDDDDDMVPDTVLKANAQTDNRRILPDLTSALGPALRSGFKNSQADIRTRSAATTGSSADAYTANGANLPLANDTHLELTIPTHLVRSASHRTGWNVKVYSSWRPARRHRPQRPPSPGASPTTAPTFRTYIESFILQIPTNIGKGANGRKPRSRRYYRVKGTTRNEHLRIVVTRPTVPFSSRRRKSLRSALDRNRARRPRNTYYNLGSAERKNFATF